MIALLDVLPALPRYASLLRSQRWDEQAWRRYRAARLEATLGAARRIPFYAERLAGVSRPADLASLPVLRRADAAALAASVRSVLPAGASPLSATSSGSTGAPVEFLFDGAHQRGRFASRIRYLRAHGWSPLATTAWLIEVRADSPDGRLIGSRSLPGALFRPYAFDFEREVAALRRARPAFLYSLPSTIEGLVTALERRGDRLPGLRRVFSGGEVLEDSLRARVRATLGVPVADNYGSTEAALAWQCERGAYHVHAEHVILEIVDDHARPVAAGAVGRVLVTTLENHLMPLVRWESGDYAVAAEGACACGRTLPTVARVLGRAMNLFRRSDGRPLSPWPLVDALKRLPGLRQLQVVQQAPDRYLVRYEAAASLGADAEGAFRAVLRSHAGEAAYVRFARVERIGRAPSGKLMTAVCEID